MKKLRQTILNQYEKCPYACKLDWGDVGEDDPFENDNDRPSNKYAKCGIALHQVMEWWGKERILGGYPLLIKCHEMLDYYFSLIPEEMFDDNEDKNEFYNSLHEQLEWLYEHNHLIVPGEVEMSFEYVGLINGLPPITGTMDRWDGSIENRCVDLFDYKTGKVYTKNELKSNIQAGLYALAFYNKYHFLPSTFTFLFSKYKKVKTIYITQEFLTASTTRIFSIYEKMKLGYWQQNAKNKYFCKHFCSHVKECPKYTIKGWEGVGFEQFRPYGD